MRFSLGDGDDALQLADGAIGAQLPWIVDAGDGNDSVLSSDAADAIDGGAGNDRLISVGGDDHVAGGDGDDDLRGGAGNDTVDGGPGKDEIDGAEGDDQLVGGSGIDSVAGGPGNDQVDMRDGEVESGTVYCDDGDDTVLADPADEIAEFGPAMSRTVEPTCEHLPGMAAPTPLHVFPLGRVKHRRARLGIDLTEAFSASLKLEVLRGKKTVGAATVARKGVRTKTKIKLSARFARALRGSSRRAKVRVTVTDTAGRTSTHSYTLILWGAR